MADDKLAKVTEKLKAIRERTDLKLKPTPHLKQTFTDLSGQEKELLIRYYQVQGILHLIFMKRFLLGDDTGLGKCVTGDTLLWTDQGLLPISSLAPQPLDQLVPGTFYEPAFPVKVWTGNKWAGVNRFYYDGLRATKKVTTRSGFCVEGSHRHPLKVRGLKGDGWRRLPDVCVGDSLLVDRQVPEWPEDPWIVFPQTFVPYAKRYTLPSRMSPDFARLLGYLVAEGPPPNRISVTQYDSEARADIRDLFQRIFGWTEEENNADVPGYQIWSFLGMCGIDPALSTDKRVPPLVMRAGRESVVGFLRGFFEAEGHAIEGSGVEVSSASERLLREVHLLLLRLGIVSVLKPKQGQDHTYWQLSIFSEDARLFLQQVGFVTRQKQDVLEKADNTNLDVVPHAFYDPVESIEDGYAEVMDIEVDDPDHCFVGNGLVNHNTLQAIAALCYIWEKDPGRKAIILTTKSATSQWAKEFGKFTKGVRVVVALGDKKLREAAYETWRKSNKPTVMIMGYRSAVNDIRKLQDDQGYILVTDEATAYKNPQTQVHQVVRHMSEMADRTWALTATLIKNHLLEGHGIYSVVTPGLFGSANN